MSMIDLFDYDISDITFFVVVSARIWLCLYWFDHQYVSQPWLIQDYVCSLVNQDESRHRTSHRPPRRRIYQALQASTQTPYDLAYRCSPSGPGGVDRAEEYASLRSFTQRISYLTLHD